MRNFTNIKKNVAHFFNENILGSLISKTSKTINPALTAVNRLKKDLGKI